MGEINDFFCCSFEWKIREIGKQREEEIL